MGAPYFEWKDVLRQANAKVFSCNFRLYGDISNRVMSVLRSFTSEIECYSIDEAFLRVPPHVDPMEFGRALKTTTEKWTGIPVSVGVSTTKTRTKLTNELCKKHAEFRGVLALDTRRDQQELLARVPSKDIWGIGRSYSKLLQSYGVTNALQFMELPESWVRSQLKVIGVRTQLELKGTACFDLATHHEPNKTIISSRSFGRGVTSIGELNEAVASYITIASRKLRAQHLLAGFVTTYIVTNKHKVEQQQYSNAATSGLLEASDYTPDLIERAQYNLRQIFRSGLEYKKAGIVLTGLVAKPNLQLSLIGRRDHQLQSRLMHTVDQLSHTWGDHVIQYAAAGVHKRWSMKSEQRSPNYTLKWDELVNAV